VEDGGVWDGKTLSRYLEQKFGVELKARQCQRLFRRLDFRLRKPRPLIAQADPQAQATHKKNSAHWQETPTLICGPLMKFIFNNTVPEAVCMLETAQ
jgi:hypothetical protein